MTTGSWTVGNLTLPLYATKTWSGADDPKRKKSNPYTMSLLRREQSPTKMYTLAGVYFGQAYIYDCLNGVQTWGPNDELELLSRLQQKINGHSFNMAVAAAESREALSVVRSSTLAVTRMFVFAANRRWDMVAREMAKLPGQEKAALYISRDSKALKKRSVGDAWLSIQYGWKPLLQDIFEAMKYLEVQTSGPRSLTYTARFRRSIVKEDSTSPPPNGRITMPSVQSISGRYRVALKEPLSTNRTLGLLDPGSVLWEKLPYSFVIDWFIPIGNYLSAISFFSGLSLTWEKTVFAHSLAQEGKLLWTDKKYVGGTLRSKSVRLTRTVGSGLGVAFPEMKDIRSAFSIGHITNALALVTGSVARMKDAAPERNRRNVEKSVGLRILDPL